MIACLFILVMLAFYLWSKNISLGIAKLRGLYFACLSRSGLQNKEKDGIMAAKIENSSSFKDTMVVEDDSSNQLLDNDCTRSEGDVRKTSVESRNGTVLLQSTYHWSVSMSPINTKEFPHSPAIIFTPATPKNQHHQSFQGLQMDSLTSGGGFAAGNRKSISSSEEL